MEELAVITVTAIEAAAHPAAKAATHPTATTP
jgi:hypothetical protein